MCELPIHDVRRLFLTPGPDWLGVDIRGLQLSEVESLWIWAYKPVLIGESLGSEYGPLPPKPPRGGECHSENSRRIREAGRFLLQHELNGQSESNRIWIRIDISGIRLEGIDFLLLATDQLDLLGWRR